jgi:hypothetical protein
MAPCKPSSDSDKSKRKAKPEYDYAKHVDYELCRAILRGDHQAIDCRPLYTGPPRPGYQFCPLALPDLQRAMEEQQRKKVLEEFLQHEERRMEQRMEQQMLQQLEKPKQAPRRREE